MLYKTAIGIIISLLFICIVIIFCAVIIKLYIKKIKEHNIKEIEFQKTLNNTILETQEQVLNNISQDLHDDIGQQLTFVNFQLEKIKLDHDDKLVDLDKLTDSVSRVSSSVRDLSHSLNSNLIIQNDLIKAIENETERIKKYSVISVSFQSFIKNYSFSSTEKIILYRIFQECISNILKHAQATAIEIVISEKPSLQLLIKDNGKGFDKEHQNNDFSLGLQSMKSRCEMINCEFYIVSKTNIGTEVLILKKIPHDN